MDLKTFCKELPKIELHAHINGSLSSRTLNKLQEIAGLAVKNVILETNELKTLSECFPIFDLIYQVTTTPQAIQLATEDIIEDFAQDNTFYLELRTTPRKVDKQMTKIDYLKAIIKGIFNAQEKYSNIIVKLLISLNRSHTIEENKENLELAIEFKEKYPNIVVGIDVSGNPDKGTWLSDLVQNARENKLYTAIHCAEVPSIEETTEILNFQPDRIGHGTYIHPEHGGSEYIFTLLKRKQIPVECCLTSNLITKAYNKYSDHHIGKFLMEFPSLPFTICTDDKGIFNTTLSLEYEHAAKNFNINKTTLWAIAFKSINYTFANENEKQLLSDKFLKWAEDNHLNLPANIS